MELLQADKFFSTARERYAMKLRRDAGAQYPWSSDPIFNEWRFCNVFREDDKTTTWFRNNIRGPLSVGWGLKDPEYISLEHKTAIVEACIIFRWFNRIETGEIIKDMLYPGRWNREEAHKRLKDVRPLVTGAFMIKTLTGYSKLDGLLESISIAQSMLPFLISQPAFGKTLEGTWTELREIPYLGPFMAHEVVQDLAHTPVILNASDKMTWSSFGPGGSHGMGRIISGNSRQFQRTSSADQATMREAMMQLLEMSKDNQNWLNEWPSWDAHTVEFWCCEFDKHCRASAGEPQKRRYP